MTLEEAIKKFEKIKKGNIYLIHQRIEGKEVFEDYSLCDMAISALEKQIPRKPILPVDTWLCPSCGESVEYQQKLGDNVLYHGQHDFCPKCGQAIDWEDEG